MPSLILIRHGSTDWTKQKRFTGWEDAPLSEQGEREILSAIADLKRRDYSFEHCFTSNLIRAKHTAEHILTTLGVSLSKLKCDWRLNERHYGALQGNLRADMAKEYGRANINAWRNHYWATPPELGNADPRWKAQLKKFSDIPLADQPRSESMERAAQRVRAFWDEEVAPQLRKNKNILIVTHTNSLRTILGDLENWADEQRGAFRIRPAEPLYFQLDKHLKPTHYEKAALFLRVPFRFLW